MERQVRLPAPRRITIVLAQLLLMLISIVGNGQQPSPQPPPPSLQQQPSPQPPQQGLRISRPEEFSREFETVPCRQEDRLNAVRILFERMGASASDLSIDRHRNVENLVVRKPGASPETIIIGAHYDKVSEGCGAIDNWTGVVAMAHLYRTLKDVPLSKTLVFVAFGKEEVGLLGSQAMVEAIPQNQLSRYCAMVNIDSLGLAAPQVMDNISTEQLRELAASLAATMRIPFAHAEIEYADGDSTPFRERRIPALTIHGLSDDHRSVIHTRRDQASRVRADGVYLGYRLALAMVARLAESPCSAYR